MKYKIFILFALLAILWGGSTSALFADEIKPLDIQVREAPSETFLSTSRRSIAVETDVPQASVMSSPTRSVFQTPQTLYGDGGWTDPFLPGGDGWEVGPGGNVGMENVDLPLGDASLPILASMFILYFLYRGVSSSKRKSNF